jgi:hypothetical protein
MPQLRQGRSMWLRPESPAGSTVSSGLRIGARTLCLLALVVGLFAACQELPVGPSLQDFDLTDIKGTPTTGNATLCCCRVTGTARNRTTVPLHATIQFAGLDSAGREISKILYFIQDLAPGATSAIDAPGFVVPCAAISRYTWEVKVRGLTYPPL